MREVGIIKEPALGATSGEEHEQGVEENVIHQGHPSRDAEGSVDSRSGTIPHALLDRAQGNPLDMCGSRLRSLSGDSLSARESLAPGHLPPLANSSGSGVCRGKSANDVPQVLPTCEKSSTVPDGDTPSSAHGKRHCSSLSCDGEREVKSSNDDPKPSSLFATAARAVLAMNKMKTYRRSSAALHNDLPRAFVPDILINVSALEPFDAQPAHRNITNARSVLKVQFHHTCAPYGRPS